MTSAVPSPALVTTQEAASLLADYPVVALHDRSAAARWADRIGVLSHGVVAGEGGPAGVATPVLLARVHGVEARIERCFAGRLQTLVDGITDRAPPTAAREVALP